jgi:acetylornithine deacetylase/succinyl-diaminopimelate desuccinylase-like protein
MQTLFSTPVYQSAWKALQLVDVLALAKQVQQIPAPTFAEAQRAEWVRAQFAKIGLFHIRQDETDSVIGFSTSQIRTPLLLLSAHVDTVFARETDLTLREDGNRWVGAGIGDNSLGVAGLLALAQLLLPLQANFPGTIAFVANACEEGLGNLQGMRAVLAGLPQKPDACVVIEGALYGSIIHKGTGVHRYRISVQTAGGHAWSDYGKPSAIHELTHLAGKILQLHVPTRPRSSLNIGKISGGTGINVIAQSASLELDLRSEDLKVLQKLNQMVLGLVEKAQQPQVKVLAQEIGKRPAGGIAPTDWLVALARKCLIASGCSRPLLTTGSTDANLPLSMGIPTVCVGITTGDNAHRLDEYIDVAPIRAGMQQLLLLILATQLQMR